MYNNVTHKTRYIGAILLIISFIMFLLLVSAIFYFADKPKAPEFRQTYQGTEIILYQAKDSHFRIPGKINNVDVVFLIDTGATNVAVSKSIAKRAKLKAEYSINAHTASGTVTGYISIVDKLTVGPVTLTDIKAVVIPGMQRNIVLLGMNVLKKFHIQQTNDKLILTVPNIEQK